MKSDLTKIPGIGKNMASHLIDAGFPTKESLKGKSPDDIYAAVCAFGANRHPSTEGKFKKLKKED